MKLTKRSWMSVLAVMFALVIAVPGDAFAQKRGGSRSSGSRSSSRSTSRPAKRSAPKRSAPKRAATPKRGAKTGKASNKGSFGSSTKKAGASKSKKKASKADQKAYDKAKANGTAFKDRKSASADFKKKNAKKYGSTYTSKPATRPGHIPQTTMVNGSSTTIIYNQNGGGYGTWSGGGMGLGTFLMYNAMADMAMRPYYDRQMQSAGYAYGPRPVVGMGGFMIFMMVIGGIVVVVFAVSVLTKNRSTV